MVEIGDFVFCDECIELAASIIAVRKASLVPAFIGGWAFGSPLA